MRMIQDMDESIPEQDQTPATPNIVRVDSPVSPPLEEVVEQFWTIGPEFTPADTQIAEPDRPLALLEKLGPSPFPRGSFPLVGFLATTYDKVSRFALQKS